MKSLTLVSILFLSVLVGCKQPEEFDIPDNVFDLHERQTNDFAVCESRLFDQLSPTNVLFAVNGCPVLKSDLDNMMLIRAEGLMKEKGASVESVSKQIEDYRVSYPKQALAQRLMVDESFRLGLVTKDEVAQHVKDAVRAVAAAKKISVKKWICSLKGFERYYFYELAVSYAAGKLVKSNIPPRAEVDHAFVTNIQAIIRAKNALVDATNSLYKAKMAEIRRALVAKEITFDGAGCGKVISGIYDQDSISDPGVADAVFKLKPGEISPVLEAADAFIVAQCLKIMPGEKGETGRLVREERRDLKMLYLFKGEKFVEDALPVLTRDLKSQMQEQAINIYVSRLLTNGTHKVEYPCGKLRFRN